MLCEARLFSLMKSCFFWFFFSSQFSIWLQKEIPGYKWHVLAWGIRVFLGLLRPCVGVSRGRKTIYFLVVQLERGSSRVTEQLLNNACVYLQGFDFFPKIFLSF